MKALNTLFSIFILMVTTVNAQISFTADVTSGCGPLTVNFTNTSTVGDTWVWSFGDGTPNSTSHSPSHTYNVTGYMTVWLYAYDSFGNYIGNHNLNIHVLGGSLSFNLENDSTCINDQTNFYVYGDGNTWEWDFGDGNTYTENSTYGGAQNTYISSGAYTVSVDVTNICGTYTIDTLINVVSSGLGFSYPPYIYIGVDTTCPNSLINMQTDYNFSGYVWDYNDGSFDYTSYVDHSFSNLGWNYIDLTVTNGCGSNITVSDSVYIDNNAPVSGEYIWEVDSVCPGEEFNIQATSNNGTSYSWDFGDGNPAVPGSNINYSYTSLGTYNVNLTITNDCGNDLVVPTQIVVSNNAPLNNAYLQFNATSFCPGDEMNFWVNDNYNFYMDFGDGTGTSTSNDWSHVYNNVGVYPVSVTYQNACGNSLTVYDTILVQNNLPINGQNIYASMNQSTICVNSVADFYAQSGFASYFWDFGDGGTSTNKDAEHIYNSTGIYNATVTITNGCGSSTTVSVIADVQDNLPVTDFYYQILGDSICPNDELFFIGDDWSNLNFVWDFGDGTTANSTYASHTYSNVGTYYVTISATNGCGNDTVAIDSVVVGNNVYPNETNVQVFVQQEGCIGDELYFVVGPANSGTYYWDFGDGNSTTQTDPILTPEGMTFDVAQHSYLSTGIYQVLFSLTNGCGNTYHDTLQVDVGTVGDTVDLEVSFWWNELEASCQGEPIEFVGVGASSYAWNFGDGSGILITQGSLVPVHHTYNHPGTYNIVVTGHNQCGNSDSRSEEIFIPQSLIDITTNAVQLANCGEADGVAVVSATGGMPPYQYSWSNGDNSVIADSLYSGLYVITVTDNNECSSEGIVTVSDNQGPTILVDNISNINCYGQNTGTISVSILGGAPPYEILWSNGDQTEDIYGLVAGPYEIFVTDANGCMSMESILVTQPSETVVSVISQPSVCGGNNGSAMAVISNGAAPFNYIWPNQTGPVAQTGGLSPGIYELLVIDANTCLLQQEFMVNESGAPIILLDSVITGTCSGNLSSIYINTIGGTGPFTYDWSDGSTSQDLINVLPGNYSVEITDQNGCSSYLSESVEMEQPLENPICIVTVDTLLGGNIVVWEPVQISGLDYYNVYKESSQSGLYYLIGSTDADSLSYYHDLYSDPNIRSWRYKISAVDDCGNESELSDEHKTIHLSANIGVGNIVNLIWDNYEGFSYSTFYVNRYHPTTGWMVIDSVSSNSNSYTDLTPPSDSNLIYQITIVSPDLCTAQKSVDHNTTRSNRGSVNSPEEVETPDGLSENNVSDLIIYPNPNDGRFTLYFDGVLKGAKVEIFNLQGQLLNEIVVSNSNSIFDITNYENGIYLLKISSSSFVRSMRIVKH